MDNTNVDNDRINELETSIKASMLLSSAIAGLMTLKDDEPYEHTKRYRELKKAEESLYKLFMLYNPKDLNQYDIVKIGEWFHLKMEKELKMFLSEKGYLNYKVGE
jgi:hypothetical protein